MTTYFTRRFWIDAHGNFDKRGLRGCDVNILPFFRVFPPESLGGWGKGWTVHFGWLFWTVGVHSRQMITRVLRHDDQPVDGGYPASGQGGRDG